MIVPMKKITIIAQGKDANSAVAGLRDLGLLHIEHQQPPKGKEISVIQEDLNLVRHAVEILSITESAAECKKDNRVLEIKDWKVFCAHIVDTRKRLEQLQQYSEALSQRINDWEAWGDFDPSQIQHLAEQGVFIKLYKVASKEINRFPQDLIVKTICVKSGTAYCAVIGRTKFEAPFKELELPKNSLAHMRNRWSGDNRTIKQLQEDLCGCVPQKEFLLNNEKEFERELEFYEALAGMNREGALSYIVGYAPAKDKERFLRLARQQRWGILVSVPSEEDNVPVLLQNPKWVSIINPVFKLMDVVPGYRELDVSPIFLLFLSLFFGMIIGDAGYGTVYFLLTGLAQYKLGSRVKDKSVFFLFYLFSFCAIIWGLLTGTVFGQEWYLAKGFKALLPVLNETKALMAFCFFLGALQLSLAHCWQAVTKLPSLKALADIGFICLLWAGFFLAKMFILGDSFPSFGKWLIWAGVLCIIFFSDPQRNVFKAAIKGLGVLALGLMGNFGDVVSYIRLFAVGLAGVALSNSVNTLAAGFGNNIIAQVITLFIGHSINIILGPISILVHGVRLNVLEFSLLHGNVTWGGLAYKPLKS